MLEKSLTPRTHLKSVKDTAAQLKTHNDATLNYNYHQQLQKSAAQNYNQSNQVNPPRAARKVNQNNLNLISNRTETSSLSNSSEETCDIDYPNTILLDKMINRIVNNNKFNRNGNKHTFFDKDNMIPK